MNGIEHLIRKLDERLLSLDELFRLLAEYRESIGPVEAAPSSATSSDS